MVKGKFTKLAFLVGFLFWGLNIFVGQSYGQTSFILSKNPDFSTDDRIFSRDDTLFMLVTAPDIDFTDLDKNEFRLKADSDGDKFEGRFTNNFNGTYTAKLSLKSADPNQIDWEWRARIRDDSGNEFRAEVAIKIIDGVPAGKEVTVKGKIDSLGENFLKVDGNTVFVTDTTVIVDEDNQALSFNDLKKGDQVEIKAFRDEMNNLIARRIEVKRPLNEKVEIKGKIEDLGENFLVVSGLTIFVDENTEIQEEDDKPISFNDLKKDQVVKVKALKQADGTLLALKIKVEEADEDEVELTGTIQSIQGDTIVVDGVAFLVTESTEIRDNDEKHITLADLTVGLVVEIRGKRAEDGFLRATHIKVEDRDLKDDEVEITGEVKEVGDNHLVVDTFTFQVDENTKIRDDKGNPITLQNIQVGFIVKVRANVLPDSSLLATKIKIEDRFKDEVELTGVIEAIGDDSLVVNGRTFFVTDSTVILDDEKNPIAFTDLQKGEVVEIRAEVLLDGTLIATRIKVEGKFKDEVELTGTIESIGTDSLVVSGFTFFVDANTVILDNKENPVDFSTLIVGMIVEIRGRRQADGSLLATKIKIEDRIEDEVEITGLIEDISDSTITVAGLTFKITKNTVILDNNKNPIQLADLSPGQTVEVRGDLLVDGTLVAIRIKLENRQADEVEMSGPIEVINENTLQVLGVTFQITDATQLLDDKGNAITLTDLQVGQTVEVRGIRQADGSIVATKVKLEDVVLISGSINSVSNNNLTILDTEIQLDANTLLLAKQNQVITINDLTTGQVVQVRGQRLSGSGILATKIKVQRASVITAITSDEPISTPVTFLLHQNYPNPFNPSTTITFEIPNAANGAVAAKLVIYNLLGQVVRTLVDKPLSAGQYRVQWDGRDEQGRLLSSGVYLYQLKAGSLTQTRRMILLK